MRFWDSSALVPLVVDEDSTGWARRLLRSDPHGLVWALTPVEVRSALTRRHREGALSAESYRLAGERANGLFRALSPVIALEPVRDRALRLLDLHPLRAADALQLAAALIASGERPETLSIVTLDRGLADAARSEGFPVEFGV